MPGDAKPRWITVRSPFDYRWPESGAITFYSEPGEQLVKAEVADFAVEKGYATEGKVDGSTRSNKGGGKRARRSRRKKEPTTVTATNAGPAAPVDNEAPADANRAADRPPVDHDAGER